jgi:DNA-binding NarL/FixJ family response regulator
MNALLFRRRAALEFNQPLLSEEERVALLAIHDVHTAGLEPISLVFADPHPVVLDGLRRSFQHHPDFSILECVPDAQRAWCALKTHKPDILVMEMTLGGQTSLDLIRSCKREKPSTKLIVFTQPLHDLATLALPEGVQGLISKSRSSEILMDCIKAVNRGVTWIDDDFAQHTQPLANANRSDYAFEGHQPASEKNTFTWLMLGSSR